MRGRAPSLTRRSRLLGGSALCGAAMLIAMAAHGQTLPGIPDASAIKVDAAGAKPNITAGTNSLDVDLKASHTVINWDSFHVSGSDSVTFHFAQTADIVLNKSPTQVKVDAGGTVSGLVGSAVGGNIWFYSPGGVVIAPGAVMTAGNFVFARGDAIVDMEFVASDSPLSVLRSASDALIQIDTITSATSASINASGDLVLTASSGDLNATTALGAGSATVSATTGAISIGEVTASGGVASVTATAGGVTVGELNGSDGASATGTTVSVTSASASGGNADIVLTGTTSASLDSGSAGRDLKVLAPAATLGGGSAGRDVFVTATTGPAGVTGSVTAGGDIEVTATTGSVAATNGSLTTTGTAAGAHQHVLAKSTGGAVALGSAATQGTGSNAGDITISGATTAALTSGSSTRDITVSGPSATLASGTAAGSVFVTATTGTAKVTGVVSAGDDIEVTATSGSVAASGSLTSTGANASGDAHVLAKSTSGAVSVGSATTEGTGSAAGDITVSGATTASLSAGSSSADIHVTGPSASLGSADAAGDVFVTATTGTATVSGTVTAGDDIEVTATTGSVSADTGSLTSTGAGANSDAHVLAQSTGGAVNVGSAATQGTGNAAGDITISGATSATLGAGSSSRDITVQGPSADLGASDAARDIFVKATTGAAHVTGAVTAGDDVEITSDSGSVTAGGANLKATGAGAVSDAHVLVKSNSGSVNVGSATTQGTGGAAGDVTVQGATTANLNSGHSARDITVSAPTATLGSGSAGRDIFVTSTTGPASVTGAITAGDDIEVTATSGDVTASGGSLTSTGAGAVGDAHVLVRSTGGSVNVGVANTQGTGGAAGDVTVDGSTGAVLNSGGSSRDIVVTGPTAGLGDGAAARDVLVTSTTGTASATGTITAGDDIEVKADSGAVNATGSLTSTGAGAFSDAHVLVKSNSNAVTVGSAATQGTGGAVGDVTIDGSTTASVTGTVTSTGDIVVKAGDILANGSTIAAGRDLSVNAATGNVTVGTVRAGDDVALRALTGFVKATGDVEAGTTHANGDPDPSGAADTLAGATLTGHDVDIKAQTVQVTGDVSAGRAPDNGETLGAAQLASDVIVSVTNPDPNASTAALRVATGSNKTVSAHQDIVLRADNASASSVNAGGLSAGRDVAVYSAAGNITLDSALAGDDVVLRAPGGKVDVAGDVAAGRDSPGMTPTDSAGAGDDLNAAQPFIDFDGNPGTVFKVVGFDVSIVSQQVHVGGTTIAGRQPSTDDPDTAGPVDTTTSDVRIETRLSPTPVVGLSPDITLGAVIATRDLQIDSYKAVTTGDLKAGRDIAVLGRGGVTPGAAANDHTGAGVTIASAHAGDDALAFSIYGRTHILGGVTAGAPFARLVPTNDRVIDGATEAADQLAIYLHYFDLDDASAPYVLKGGVIHLYGQGVSVGGALSAQGLNADIRVRSTLDIDVSGASSAGGLAIFQTDAVGGGSVKVGAVTAAKDVLLDGVGAQATGTVTSTGGDVAVRGRDGGAIQLKGISAGDDIVLRTTGAITVNGAVSTGGASDGAGAADDLRATDGSVSLEGQTFDLTGHDIDIVGGSVTTTGTMNAGGANGDVRVQSQGVISLGAASAGRDVLVDGATTVSTGLLGAGRDVGVRSTGANSGVTVGGASADDDVVIRANGSITITGPLSAGGGADSAATDQAGDLMFGVAKSNLSGDLDLAGGTLDVRSTGGSISVTGDASAATDARFQTAAGTGGSVKVAAVTAGRNLLLDGGSGAGANGVQATGTLTSTGGDVAVRARDGKAISLADVSAGDDVVLRATGAITTGGPVTAGGATDSAGFGDVLRTTEGAVTLEGQTFDLAGHDIDIVGGAVTATGTLTASGSTSDVRVQSAGAIALGDAAAGRDVLIDGGSTVATGLLSAGRDVGVRSTGDGAGVTVGGASAGDDVVIRAKGAITITGDLSAGGGADSAEADQAGDLMFDAARSNLGGDLDLAGQTVDVRSSAGSIEVTGATTATTDARFQSAAGAGGSVKVGAVTAGRDLLLDGGAGAGANGAEATGTLTATGDVAVRARDGKAIKLAGISAGDDVVLRASGAISTGGPVNAGGGADAAGLGDGLRAAEGSVVLEGQAFDLTGHDIDIVGGSVSATAALIASGATSDVRVKSAGAIDIKAATAGRDVLVDGADTVSTGLLTAGRDVGVRSTGDGAAVTVGGATAGDDVVIRAKGNIKVTADLNAGAGADSAEADQAGDLMFNAAKSRLAGDLDLVGRNIDVRSSAGSIQVTGGSTAATDARFQTQSGTGGAVTVGAVTAGRDILLDGSGVQAAMSLTATEGDVAVRARDGQAIRLAGASAGDDAVLRTSGALLVSGTVTTTGHASIRGLGDRLADGTESGALTIGGMTFDLNGSDVDIGGGSIDVFKTNARSSARIKAGSASLAGGATAGIDILIDSDTSLTIGDMSALGDIALRSRSGRLMVGRVTAGDDLVLRGAQGVTGISLKAGGGPDHFGVGDQMALADPITLGDAFDLTGSTIDVRSAGGPVAIGDATASGDVRLQSMSGEVSTTGAVSAGRDILADGASVTASGSLTAAGDVALYGRTGGVSVNTVSAGDDIVIRAMGDVTADGELKSGQNAPSDGAGDRLAAFTESASLFGEPTDDDGGVIDVRGSSIKFGGAITAAGDNAHLRLKSDGAITLGDANLSGDVAIDAGGDVSAGALKAGRDIAVRLTSGALSIASASAGDDIVLRAGRSITVGGQLSAGGGGDRFGAADALFSGDRTALGGDFDLSGQTLDIRAAGAVNATGSLAAAGDVRIQATGGLSASDVKAGRDALLDGASVQAGAVQAGGDIAIRATTGALSLNSASAGDDLVLRGVGDISVAGAVSAGGGPDRDGVADRLFATDRSSLGGLDFDLAGHHIDVKSSTGAITTQGAVTAADDVRLSAAGRVAVGGQVDGGRDVLLDGASVTAANVRAGRDVAVRGQTGAVSLGSVTAGDDLVLRAAGDLTITGQANAGGGADGDGAGDRLFAGDRTGLGGDFDLAGANIDARGKGAITTTGTATAGRDARFQTSGAGAVSLADVKAGGDVLADGAQVKATGQITAGRDIAVRGRDGTVELAALTAGDDIAVRAKGAVKVTGALSSGSGADASGAADRLITSGEGGAIMRLVDPLAAMPAVEGFALKGGAIDIKSGDAVTLGGDATAAGTSGIRLEAKTKLSVAGLTAGDGIFARAADLSLNGPWRANLARLEITATGGVALGDGASASGALALSGAQIGRIEASTLQIFVGDSSGSMRGANLAIGALGIDTSKIKTSLELYAGGSTDVAITGALAPTAGTANTTTLRIGAPTAGPGDWTPRSIRIIANNGGSIGFANTIGGRTFTDVRAFGTVELNAKGDILMGYQDFIDRLSTTSAASVPGVVKSLIAPQTTAGPRILITAGGLILRADGKVAQQDTSGILGQTPTGLYLLGAADGPQLLLGRTSAALSAASALPEFIELNGALTSGGTVMVGQSVSLTAGIAFDKGVTPNGYYRLNGCAILQQADCMSSNQHPTIAIPPDQLTGLTIEDHTAAAGTADPTVASATNEEVWKDSN